MTVGLELYGDEGWMLEIWAQTKTKDRVIEKKMYENGAYECGISSARELTRWHTCLSGYVTTWDSRAKVAGHSAR